MANDPLWMTPLWAHQKDAVKVFREYLRRRPAPQAAALVSMPTGTGKSAVIASLIADSRSTANKKNVLVIAPWRGLASQLAEDIDAKVWSHLGVDRPPTLPSVQLITRSADFVTEVEGAGRQPKVWVTTMAMVVQIFKAKGSSPTNMAALFRTFSCILVDECHYEPAPTWSAAVRATKLPTCLMTATPFRNDNKFFVLDHRAQYRYSHTDAVQDGVLREPQFHVLKPVANEIAFAKALRSQLKALKVAPAERVIVRCAGKASVTAMVKALRDEGEVAHGFHETFDAEAEADGLFRYVPAPSKRLNDVRFWVHQHKLTEGFDHPGLTVLAIYEGFGSDRARIQQIGRVLRRGDSKISTKAHVLTFNDEMSSAWNRYRRFDAGDAPHAIATDPAGIEALLEAQPESFYWDRLFREQVNLHADDAWKQINFRLSASVREVAQTPDLDQVMKAIADDHIEQERKVLSITTPAPAKSTRVLIYLTVKNSPVLLSGAFVEMSLGYTLVHWDGTRLFVADSRSSVPRSIQDSTYPVSAQDLVTLLPDAARISTVSLVNNDLGPWSVRARSITATDLGRIAPEVGGSTFGYATATGSMTIGTDNVTRYAGVRNARVRDQRPSAGTLQDAIAWFTEIGTGIDAKGTASHVIRRYSTPVPTPAIPEPTHVLLDVDPESFEPLAAGAPPLTVDEWGGPVDKGRFGITLAGEKVVVGIRWSDTDQRFELDPDTEIPYRSRYGAKASFFDEVQRSRSLLVADESGVSYTNGNFWSLELTGRGSPQGLLSIVTGHASLRDSTGEKGTVTADRWDPKSVFGIIDQDLLPLDLGSSATILCTDMGTEIADFVGFSKSKIVFAHAKGKSQKDKSYVSASSLHELVSQAMKNMKYLAIGNEESPSTRAWTKQWTDGSHGKASRHRAGAKSNTGDAYWKRINKVVQSHGAEREVWLVLGASLSRSRLETALKQPKPPGYAVTAHALLASAWSTSQQYGVRLRVICSP